MTSNNVERDFLFPPQPRDPWPGGHTTVRWPCWCTVCKGQSIRMRHKRDDHMIRRGIYTTVGVSLKSVLCLFVLVEYMTIKSL